MRLSTLLASALGAATLAACGPQAPPAPVAAVRPPDLLLITLDTTRADAMGWENARVETPHLTSLAERGRVFSQAYTTAPMTLPAHTSMLTGLYPAEHGIHENARYLSPDRVLVAEILGRRGYRTAAFVSGLPLSRQFGLARGFEHYDDEVDDDGERDAAATTRRAVEYLRENGGQPLFLWVHYFDPHEPYAPPEPWRSRYPDDPYLGEIAFMDAEIGRLLTAFEESSGKGDHRILVVGDHGEGRGEHGEALHGNLLYQGVVRVPLVIAGNDFEALSTDRPVSVRRVYDTLLDMAGEEHEHNLLDGPPETVLAEAMKPFLQYGWQPQVMAVRGTMKVIRAGDVEVFDLAADPAESVNLESSTRPPRELVDPLLSYPLPEEPDETSSEPSQEDLERLAGLGYVSWRGTTELRADAPAAREMTFLFADLDRGSAEFVRGDYRSAKATFGEVLERDPGNLMVCLRLAVAHSLLGEDARAMELFARARDLAPGSADVRHYFGLHLLRTDRLDEAAALFETVVAESPNRLPTLEALARIRQRQGRLPAALALYERVAALDREPAAALVNVGELRMAAADTAGAIRAFERARSLVGDENFGSFLELGVLYLADRQPARARDALDRVVESHPGYAMALFKRAQVSVLLGEPDREERIRTAWRRADEITRPLIEREALFRGIALR